MPLANASSTDVSNDILHRRIKLLSYLDVINDNTKWNQSISFSLYSASINAVYFETFECFETPEVFSASGEFAVV